MNHPLLFAVVLVAGGVACSDVSKESPKQDVKQDVPCPGRYVPVGNNPDIALDTQTGSLCRTVVYANAARGGIAPQVGVIIDGYRFKGGDPSDKANWERTAEQNPDKYATLPACGVHQSFSEWKKSQSATK
jgi:glucose dehydrogenase